MLGTGQTTISADCKFILQNPIPMIKAFIPAVTAVVAEGEGGASKYQQSCLYSSSSSSSSSSEMSLPSTYIHIKYFLSELLFTKSMLRQGSGNNKTFVLSMLVTNVGGGDTFGKTRSSLDKSVWIRKWP